MSNGKLTKEQVDRNFGKFMQALYSGVTMGTKVHRCAVCHVEDPEEGGDKYFHGDSHVRRVAIHTGGVLCWTCYERYLTERDATKIPLLGRRAMTLPATLKF